MAIASTSWAAFSLDTPIKQATHSWFPEGYNVAVAPAKTTPADETGDTSTEAEPETAGKQNTGNASPSPTTDARNRVPVTAQPSQSTEPEPDKGSDETDAPEPKQPEPTTSKLPEDRSTQGPKAPPTSEPEPTPSNTPTSEPTEDPGDDGEEEDDGGIIIIDIDLPLPLPLLGAPGPDGPVTGTNTRVETGIPGAVPGTGKQTSVSFNIGDLVAWSYILWQTLA